MNLNKTFGLPLPPVNGLVPSYKEAPVPPTSVPPNPPCGINTNSPQPEITRTARATWMFVVNSSSFFGADRRLVSSFILNTSFTCFPKLSCVTPKSHVSPLPLICHPLPPRRVILRLCRKVARQRIAVPCWWLVHNWIVFLIQNITLGWRLSNSFHAHCTSVTIVRTTVIHAFWVPSAFWVR